MCFGRFRKIKEVERSHDYPNQTCKSLQYSLLSFEKARRITFPIADKHEMA